MSASRSGSGRTRTAASSTVAPRKFTGRFAYLRRADWGVDDSDPAPSELSPVQVITLHHTATANADPDPAGTVRRLHREHVRDLGDLGFHLLIDDRGGVYEGRRSGGDGTPVFGPSRKGQRPVAVTGAHVDGFDPGNVGIALLGDLSAVEPTTDARAALVRVLASLVHTTQIDPLGRTRYVHPATGATRDVPVIGTLADWSDDPAARTTLDRLVPELRAEVAGLLLG